MFIRMRTFVPQLNSHFQNQYVQAQSGYNTKDYELLIMWYFKVFLPR